MNCPSIHHPIRAYESQPRAVGADKTNSRRGKIMFMKEVVCICT